MELSPSQRTALAVKRLQHRHHRELDARLRGIGTTLSQWDALRHVARSPGASTRELAALTFMTDQSFGALAIKLAEQGLVARTPGQGRVVHHAITPEGEAILEKATTIADQVFADSFAPLSEADRATLENLLTRVLDGWTTRDRPSTTAGLRDLAGEGGSGGPARLSTRPRST